LRDAVAAMSETATAAAAEGGSPFDRAVAAA
jgi:hypothetical protein